MILIKHPDTGEIKSIKEWADHIGISPKSFSSRYHRAVQSGTFGPETFRKKDEVKKIKHPITGEIKSIKEWAEHLRIKDATFRVRCMNSLREHGRIHESIFTPKTRAENQKKEPKKNTKIHYKRGCETSITRRLKRTGCVTKPLNIDTRRVYKRTPKRELLARFSDPKPKVDLEAIGAVKKKYMRGVYNCLNTTTQHV